MSGWDRSLRVIASLRAHFRPGPTSKSAGS
jgi:hypothetical protein